ncbi:MAG: hypothetical protein IPG02_17390 [Ignavibacteria bacterium]|nr:hypothetical protein [Ignavibacteria bacterium]
MEEKVERYGHYWSRFARPCKVPQILRLEIDKVSEIRFHYVSQKPAGEVSLRIKPLIADEVRRIYRPASVSVKERDFLKLVSKL